MAEIELVTEQFGYDEEGTPWRLIHRDPNEWERIEVEEDVG